MAAAGIRSGVFPQFGLPRTLRLESSDVTDFSSDYL